MRPLPESENNSTNNSSIETFDWDLYLDQLALAFNTATHATPVRVDVWANTEATNNLCAKAIQQFMREAFVKAPELRDRRID